MRRDRWVHGPPGAALPQASGGLPAQCHLWHGPRSGALSPSHLTAGGQVAGQCPGQASTATCFNHTTYALNDPNDPWVSTAVQWLTGSDLFTSFARVRVNHFAGNTSLYTTLEMGFQANSTGEVLPLSATYGPYGGFSMQWRTISVAPSTASLSMVGLVAGLAIALLG